MARKETERDRLMKDMQAAGNQPKGFSGWFRNVFLYHYLKPILIGIVAVVLVVFIAVDLLKDNSRDFIFTIFSDGYFSETRKEVFYDLFAREIGDANGNGKLEIDIVDQAIVAGGADASDAAQKMQAFEVTFIGDPSCVLYLIHEDYLTYFEPETSYWPLSDFGIESESTYFLYANDFPTVKRFLPESNENKYYFAIKACEISKRDKPEYAEYYDRALKALQAIMTAP